MKWIYFIIINVIAFSMMGLDKRKAKKKQWRTPESTLFLSAVAGGAVGAWIGMYMFHHKTHKSKFVFGIPVLVIITVGVFLYI
ncbi:DUF1294 domain-containing protein [Bacillus mycoides]|uniref:DUF1294 domain-containing protein n=1 Tax=Bacillus cereus TaxID=1396 RepID=A0A1S9TJ10_BACCE|nr:MULTISPECIES: DUF1294 domain-containing protein [Bacillus cereus group]EOO20065.1 hypothetical protein IG9_01125 [Bacillus cereus HuA2-9]KZD27897.1 putative membrane protein [Bacillus cereus]MEC5240145.1 DUF1294 domain-containing protein [Bacillus mycoides]MEC5264432.1 DUF1294 domain-containing protein [Bacillus mycoides]OOR09571.1 hypothetical protein BW897_27025 [Bacillus cereus]